MIENISVSLEKHSESRDAARQLVSTLVVRERDGERERVHVCVRVHACGF